MASGRDLRRLQRALFARRKSRNLDREDDLEGGEEDGEEEDGQEGGDFNGADLSGVDFPEADLREVSLDAADFSGANLGEADFSGAKLHEANFRGANLIEADFGYADLSGADLTEADLTGATLPGAKLNAAVLNRSVLTGADLSRADLSEADLSEASLGGADLSEANLREANLSEADLRGAVFFEANLSGADLCRTDLSGANLVGANLSGAKLSGAELSRANLALADLRGADLHESRLDGVNLQEGNLSGANLNLAHLVKGLLIRANLSGADCRDVDFREASLIDSRLDGANITNSRLWETQRGGWSIKGVICQRVFWERDDGSSDPTQYRPGDFERIFSERPQIVLHYPGGISSVDLVMLPLIIERLQAEHPDCAIRIRSVQDDGNGAVVVIAVEDTADRGSNTFQSEVERLQTELKYIEGQRDLYRDQFLPIFRELVLRSGQTIIGQITNPAVIEESMNRDTYNIYGQAGSIGPKAHAHDMTFEQLWNHGRLELPQLAKELARLRTIMKTKTQGTAEQDEEVGAVARAEKAAVQGDGPSVLRHLKAVGRWSLGVAEEIGAAIAVEAIKKAM